jgi:hypothetical protein
MGKFSMRSTGQCRGAMIEMNAVEVYRALETFKRSSSATQDFHYGFVTGKTDPERLA